MNYALDALWWRLKTPAVRDLASILTAPPLWASGCELPVNILLGEQGFRYLLALDDEPAELSAYLSAREPFAGRLGFYAEALLAFWLDHAPHSRLLAHNLPVRDAGGRSLGALDFVAEIGGGLYHLELCCKYYGETETAGEALCGLNRDDRLADKAAKLAVQTAWPQTPEGRAALRSIGIETEAVQSVSVVRGMLFLRDRPSENAAARGRIWAENRLFPMAWEGMFVDDWAAWAAKQPDGARYCVLPRMAYLAPARVAETQTLACAELEGQSNILFARVEKRPDGFWHETGRLMKR